tara:strand:+ start:381 stop:584 length:204 start_codon:yes stop_codon:yes gene_type:complete
MAEFMAIVLVVILYMGLVALIYLYEDPDEAIRDSIFSKSSIEREKQRLLDQERARKYNDDQQKGAQE